jgi:hypothetical protein
MITRVGSVVDSKVFSINRVGSVMDPQVFLINRVGSVVDFQVYMMNRVESIVDTQVFTINRFGSIVDSQLFVINRVARVLDSQVVFQQGGYHEELDRKRGWFSGTYVQKGGQHVIRSRMVLKNWQEALSQMAEGGPA